MSNLVKLLKNNASIEAIKVDLFDNKNNSNYINMIYKNENAFMHACYKGRLDVVKLFLDNGVDVNICSYNSPLMEATNLEIIKLLLESDADVDYRNPRGITALLAATSYSSDGLDSRMDKIKILVNAGADVNIGSYNHVTPLMWACDAGNVECVKLLLDAGANVNVKDNGGNTPLLKAIYSNKFDINIIKLLLNSGE